VNKAQLAEQLLATFLDELDEQLGTLNAELLVLERAPANPDPLRSIFRVMHTLKGAARAVNVPAVELACHALESLLATARTEARPIAPGELALLFRGADALGDAGRRLRMRESLAGSPIAVLGRELAESPAAVANATRSSTPATPSVPAASASMVAFASPSAAPPAPAERGDGALRVESEKLDALLAGFGSASVAGGRIMGHATTLSELVGTMHQLLGASRTSPRTRRPSPSAPARVASDDEPMEHRLERAMRQIERIASAVSGDVSVLDQSIRELSERVRQLRMRPVSDACAALPRVARDVAMSSGKDVDLVVTGATVEADRAVLDGIREPLVQLVRNAVDHGIEPPAVREAHGKPRRGVVTVSASLRADRLLVAVSDDGAGIDEAQVRESLRRAGHPLGDDPRAIGEALLAGGVTTRAEASAFSGRGVGLDVARAAVERLGGRLEVTWLEGRGATFTLETPLILARIRAVTVEVGTQTLGLPTSHVERLVRLPRSAIQRAEGRDVFAAATEGAHALVPLVPLARLLGPPFVERPTEERMAVVLLRIGGARVGVVVDALLGEDELYVRALPGRRSVSAHVSGAAILPTGGIALLLDVASLLRIARTTTGAALIDEREGASRRRRSTVLIVDDSLTTRTLERSVLETAGYSVKTAVDGADGWRVIDEEGCDLVVADVEMPRMNGLALCQAIRANERHRTLPVVLVTALDSDDDRAAGLAAGADAYITKSNFDQRALLDTVSQLLDPEAA
jgi:two-component system chemotaxis sensor kinase CheA